MEISASILLVHLLLPFFKFNILTLLFLGRKMTKNALLDKPIPHSNMAMSIWVTVVD